MAIQHFQFVESKSENFRRYADWRLSQFNVTKQSTIWVEWKFLRLLYKRVAGKKMDEIVGEQVSEESQGGAKVVHLDSLH
ncbi:predicted protein [Histoplasma mississippiense (nom. inval.)]|uniref:predicted protein n=1 Tax=Ajellomyces capsulatus (strain NAm1 / WU24) TaxID=2059318 RepID=UPI000157B591|nr:predicted protein [Histoplasma mississippiense (nom. inval.)]EDN02617.1 predicted protein [Histoplasma mississippiense (nom. inval.)]